MRCNTSLSSKRSSRLVDEATISIAGNILRLDNLLSSCNSMLPVPLNSSKITSSILLPVSTSAVAIIVSEPEYGHRLLYRPHSLDPELPVGRGQNRHSRAHGSRKLVRRTHTQPRLPE